MTDDDALRRTPQQARSRARVEAILEAATAALRDGGPDAVTTSRVATDAGTSVASVYRYFPDRAALLAAIAARYLDAIHDLLDARLRGLRTVDDARTALRAVVEDYVALFRDDPALRHLWAGTLADPVLTRLNVEDSLRNGALIAERLGPFSPLDDVVLRDRSVLAAHLTQATLSLVLQLDGDDGRRLLAEFASWTDLLLLPDAGSAPPST